MENQTTTATTATTAKMLLGDGSSPLDGEARLGGKPNSGDKMPLGGGYPHQNDVSPFYDDAYPEIGTPYKGCLIVTDFDGTLYPADNPCQYKANLTAACEFRDGGGRFCIATGRSLESLWEHPEAVSLCDFVIALDGAALYCRDVPLRDRISFSAIYTAPLDRDTLTSFYRSVEKLRVSSIFMTEDAESSQSTGELLKVRLWCPDRETMDAVMAKAESHRGLLAYAYALADTETNFDYPRLPWVEPWRFMVDITDAGMGYKSRAAQEVVKATGASTVITVGDAPNDLGLIMAYQGYAVNPGFVLSGWVPEKRRLRAFTDLFTAAPELKLS